MYLGTDNFDELLKACKGSWLMTFELDIAVLPPKEEVDTLMTFVNILKRNMSLDIVITQTEPLITQIIQTQIIKIKQLKKLFVIYTLEGTNKLWKVTINYATNDVIGEVYIWRLSEARLH